MAEKLQKPKFNKYDRRQESIDYFIVIAVEGDATESRYFEMIENKFKNTVKLELISAESKSHPKHILKKLEDIKRKYFGYKLKERPKSYWMVCDVDLHANLYSTLKTAKENGFKIAISNPCFEVWLFSHLAEIKIEEGITKFCKSEEEILLEINNKEKPARDLSKKVGKALDKVRPKKGSPEYEHVYFEKIDDAVEKTQKNLKDVHLQDFLLEPKHIGQTRVSELISEIKCNSSNLI